MSNDQLPRWEIVTDHHSQYFTRQNTWAAAGAVWFTPDKGGMWGAHVRVPGSNSRSAHLVTEAEAKAWVELTVGLIYVQ
jgi:hypothetical protein